MTTPLVQQLIEEADFHKRQAKTYRVNSIGRMQHDSTERLLREAAEALAGRAEPIAYVVMAKDGSIGPKIAPKRWATFSQLMAEMEADDWVKHGHATIEPLYTTPPRAGGVEVGDG